LSIARCKVGFDYTELKVPGIKYRGIVGLSGRAGSQISLTMNGDINQPASYPSL
jgi:hypothetical protein